MQKNTFNNHNNNKYSEMKNLEKENIICKDGFCSLANQKEIAKKDENNLNYFDPV